MARRDTTESFIVKAKLVHGDKYDYSKVNYINNSTKVAILCPIHGEFTQRPDDHTIRNAGCKQCGIEARAIKKTLELNEFIGKSVEVHGLKYNYSNTVYANSRIKVAIGCSIHGIFEQKPFDHIGGQGCPKCANKNVTTEEFITKAKLIHGNKYNYDKVTYVNNTTKIIITCPAHGDFEQTPNNHLTGSGCYLCPTRAGSGFDPGKQAYLYYLKITTDTNQMLYKIGITNRTVNERFNLTDLSKIEIIKQKLYIDGAEALKWETKLKRMYKEYQYKGPDILSSGNTELFTEDIIAMWDNAQVN